MSGLRVLVVDDEADMLRVCRNILVECDEEGDHPEVITEVDATRAAQKLNTEEFDLIFVDLKMPGINGVDLARLALERDPGRIIVFMTAYPTIESATASITLGVFDYLTKPFTSEQLRFVFLRAAKHRRLAEENRFWRTKVSGHEEAELFLGSSPAVMELLSLADRFAESDSNILIVGETGTGKTLLAKRIHRRSPRREAPFVDVDCGALPETLLESELFGHQKGAFTGAASARRGLLEHADAGTVLLDDLCELPLTLQAKLLGALQERRFRRVGGNDLTRIKARFIAAMNRSPKEEITHGRLREDLFFRLNILRLDIPPLRQRPGDILTLASIFLERYGRRRGVSSFGDGVTEALQCHPWPGNVRELQNVIERACTMAPADALRLADLPHEVVTSSESGNHGRGEFAAAREAVLAEFELEYFAALVEACAGNISRAAQRAGLSRTSIYRYLTKHDLAAECRMESARESAR